MKKITLFLISIITMLGWHTAHAGPAVPFITSAEKRIDYKITTNQFTSDDEKEREHLNTLQKNNDFVLKFELKEADEAEGRKFQIKTHNDRVELRWNGDTNDKIIILSDFYIENYSLYLKGDVRDFRVSPIINGIYEKMKNEVQEKKAKLLNVYLVTEKNSDKEVANYEFEVEEQRKLFWLFPVKVKVSIKIGAEDNKLKKIKYNWMGLFFINHEYANNIITAPNLAISNVEVEPKSLHPGGQVAFKVTVSNKGISHTSVDGATPSQLSLYFGNDFEIQSLNSDFSLAPGKFETFDMIWTDVLCDVPINITIDPNNLIKESNKEDNTWQYLIRCAPTDAPDLTVESVNLVGNHKKIGEEATLRFNIKNQGTQSSEQTSAEFTVGKTKTTDLIPPLNPDETYVSEISYTPETCDRAFLKLDNLNNILETNEDNNITYEPENNCSQLSN